MTLKNIPKEWLILLVIALLITIIVIIDWSKSSSKPNQANKSNLTNDQTVSRQEKEEANVTVVVEYLKDKSDDKNITFAVLLDTHSVDLNSFDFQKDIVLEKNPRASGSNPTKVTTNGSDHHRSGEIVFPNTPPPFILVLKNIANINRREFLFEKLQ